MRPLNARYLHMSQGRKRRQRVWRRERRWGERNGEGTSAFLWSDET